MSTTAARSLRAALAFAARLSLLLLALSVLAACPDETDDDDSALPDDDDTGTDDDDTVDDDDTGTDDDDDTVDDDDDTVDDDDSAGDDDDSAGDDDDSAGDDDDSAADDDDATGDDDDSAGDDDDATGDDDDSAGDDDDSAGDDDDSAGDDDDATGDDDDSAGDDDDATGDDDDATGDDDDSAGDDDDATGDDDDSAGDDDDATGDDDDATGDDDDSVDPCLVDDDLDTVTVCGPDGIPGTPDDDCDDLDNSNFPGNAEVCDGQDNDCDGVLGGDELDDDTDLWTECQGDCDDSDLTVFPGAPELCDGLDNNCDSVIPTDELDGDSDTVAECDGDCDDNDPNNFPGNAEVCDGADNDCDGALSGEEIDDDADTVTECDGDCDDVDPNNFPGNTEICDGQDNNCDGVVDGADSWADPTSPYRLPVAITASSYDVDGAPVVLEVDFRAALDALGDSSAFDPASLAVIVQDCSLGQPVLQAQFLDAWLGLLDKAADTDPVGDEIGSVVFLYDEDGDYATLETLPAGTTVDVALYFGGVAPPASTNTVFASGTASSLGSGVNDATFDAAAGGLLEALTLDSSPTLMSQTTSCCGNAIYTNNWTIDPMDDVGTITVLETGPVFAAIEASGSRSEVLGAYDYSYVYWMFAGRPGLWSKVLQTTTADVNNMHSNDVTDGIRPWESRQDAVSGSVSTEFTLDPAFLYADVSDDSWGVAWAYVTPPTYAIDLSNYDPYLIVFGNDWADAGNGTPFVIPSGTDYFDHIVQVVLPHEGPWADVEDETLGLVEGTTPVIAPPEAL